MGKGDVESWRGEPSREAGWRGRTGSPCPLRLHLAQTVRAEKLAHLLFLRDEVFLKIHMKRQEIARLLFLESCW